MGSVTTKDLMFEPDVLRKIEEGMLMGFSNEQCIFWANISSSRFYDVLKAHPEVSERFEALRNSPKLKAIKNVVDSIKTGDVENSKWYLERKGKNDGYAPRQELTGPEGVPLGYVYSSDTKKLEAQPPKQLEKGD